MFVPGASFAGIMLPCRRLSPRHFLWFLLIRCSNGSSPFLLWPSSEPPPCRWYLSYHNPLSQGDPTARAEQHTQLEPERPRDYVSTLLDVCWPLLLPPALGLSLLPLISSSTWDHTNATTWSRILSNLFLWNHRPAWPGRAKSSQLQEV